MGIQEKLDDLKIRERGRAAAAAGKKGALAARKRIEQLAGYLMRRGEGKVLFLTDEKALANVLTVLLILIGILLIRALVKFAAGLAVLLVAGGVLLQVFYGGKSDRNY